MGFIFFILTNLEKYHMGFLLSKGDQLFRKLVMLHGFQDHTSSHTGTPHHKIGQPNASIHRMIAEPILPKPMIPTDFLLTCKRKLKK